VRLSMAYRLAICATAQKSLVFARWHRMPEHLCSLAEGRTARKDQIPRDAVCRTPRTGFWTRMLGAIGLSLRAVYNHN